MGYRVEVGGDDRAAGAGAGVRRRSACRRSRHCWWRPSRSRSRSRCPRPWPRWRPYRSAAPRVPFSVRRCPVRARPRAVRRARTGVAGRNGSDELDLLVGHSAPHRSTEAVTGWPVPAFASGAVATGDARRYRGRAPPLARDVAHPRAGPPGSVTGPRCRARTACVRRSPCPAPFPRALCPSVTARRRRHCARSGAAGAVPVFGRAAGGRAGARRRVPRARLRLDSHRVPGDGRHVRGRRVADGPLARPVAVRG